MQAYRARFGAGALTIDADLLLGSKSD